MNDTTWTKHLVPLVGGWVKSQCEHGAGLQIATGELYGAFMAQHPNCMVSHSAFTRALHAAGYESVRAAAGRYWVGIRLDQRLI